MNPTIEITNLTACVGWFALIETEHVVELREVRCWCTLVASDGAQWVSAVTTDSPNPIVDRKCHWQPGSEKFVRGAALAPNGSTWVDVWNERSRIGEGGVRLVTDLLQQPTSPF